MKGGFSCECSDTNGTVYPEFIQGCLTFLLQREKSCSTKSRASPNKVPPNAPKPLSPDSYPPAASALTRSRREAVILCATAGYFVWFLGWKLNLKSKRRSRTKGSDTLLIPAPHLLCGGAPLSWAERRGCVRTSNTSTVTLGGVQPRLPVAGFSK